MSTTVAKYTFSSWLRKGIGSKINQVDQLGAGPSGVMERATVPISVNINTHPVNKNFDLLGPGDIIGINPSVVVRTEPLNWITNFEPNYLAFIEFYDEDFAWRYTPAIASERKLRPWIILLVLKEDEFTRDNNSLPLPSITVTQPASLPSPADSWAWAHGHVNEGYESQSDFERFLQSLHNLNDPNSDKIICRLISPRRLEPDTAYHSFVVPAFETGRKAGISEPTTGIDAQQSAWTAGSSVKFPVYYEWFFRTGQNEDFESLVKLLEPRLMDERVGRRDLDGTKPGFGLTVGTDIGPVSTPGTKPEIIGLEGSLKAPKTKSKPETLDLTKPFFSELKDIINFPAELQKQTNNNSDPVVAPPLYGENHAMEHEIDIHATGWLHTLNKDPRNRVSAGCGTSAIQKAQDDYMARAWQQVQKILDANKKIHFTAFAMTVAEAIKSNFTSKLTDTKTLLFFSPLLKKIKGSPTTLHYQMEDSVLPPASVSTSFRRIIRSRGPYGKKLLAADPSFAHEKLIQDLNSNRVSAAPPKKYPENLPSLEGITAQMPGGNLSSFTKWLVDKRWFLLLLLILLFLFIGVLGGAWMPAIVLAVGAVSVFYYLSKLHNQVKQTEALNSPSGSLETLKTTSARPEFRFVETDSGLSHLVTGSTTESTSTESVNIMGAAPISLTEHSYHTAGTPGADSIEAANFRKASIELFQVLSVKAPEKKLLPFNIENAASKIHSAVDPKTVFPRQLASLVYFSFNPDWLRDPGHLVPAMAYPSFDDPMYEKLRDISTELILPNLELVPQNTISLLETNPPFIESYMVGLNHEFGRELLWREYPTDKRGSYFRQFWDVKGIISAGDTSISPEQLAENYRDITPMDTWGSSSSLGEHNKRNLHGKKNLVLVVRGELLKKYPNTIIYAQKARIYKDPKTHVADPLHEPIIAEVATTAEMASDIKFPIFKAEIYPDIKFFGFDLTIEQAYGDSKPQAESDDWGYYFVIQQVPGEPRFGMDIDFAPDEDATTPITWDDLAWSKYDSSKKFIETGVRPTAFSPGGGDNINQWGSDSASMAYILYQKPVMIAVHAKEMLSKLNA